MNIYKEIETLFIDRFKKERNLIDKSDEINHELLKQIDFVYCKENKRIMVEVFARNEEAQSTQKRKLASDAMKMLYVERLMKMPFKKYIITVDEEKWQNSIKDIWQVKALEEFGVEILYYEIDEKLRAKLKEAAKKNLENQKKKLNE